MQQAGAKEDPLSYFVPPSDQSLRSVLGIRQWINGYASYATNASVTPKQSAITPEHRRIKELEKQIRRVEEHNLILNQTACHENQGTFFQLSPDNRTYRVIE